MGELEALLAEELGGGDVRNSLEVLPGQIIERVPLSEPGAADEG